MTINAFLEAAKKVKPAPWKGESRGHSDCAKYEHHERTEMFTVEGLEGVSDWEDWGLTEECAEFIAAARNTADEIEELRILCQTYFHEGSDSLTQQDIKRIEDRIRELVG